MGRIINEYTGLALIGIIIMGVVDLFEKTSKDVER